MTDKKRIIPLNVIPLDDNEADQDLVLLESLKNNAISKAVASAKAMINEQAPDPPEQGVFSFLPTVLTRISPFFPMSRKELRTHPFKTGMEWETSWGRITVKSGNECLSVSDETTLLSLLELAKKGNTETIEISLYQLCKMTNPNPNKLSYKRHWGSLERLMGTVFKLEILKGKGKDRKPVKEMIGNILSFAERDHETNILTIVLNIYFLEMFGQGFITNLDLKLRSRLKGDVSKSVYRFLQGQRNYEYRCHMLTMAKAINMDLSLPNYEIRRRLRIAFRELRKVEYLKKWTMPKDILTVYKSAMPSKD